MDSKLSRWCEGVIEAGWLTAIIAIPLFFNIHSDRVFEPDKLTLLRSIALLMSAAWIVKFIDQSGWRNLTWAYPRNKDGIWRMPFVLPVFLLVLVYLISTLFSVSPTVSLLGSYQRLQGTYSTFAYIVIFALMASTIRTRAQVSRVVTAVIITSIPIAFYGLLQHFDLDPLPWGGDTVKRIAGHMGNAIFVAAYLIMAVPLTLARIIDAFTSILNDEELAYADVIRSSIYIFAMAIQLIAIFWTQSRGPLVGLAAGLFAFVLIVLVSLRQAVGKRRFGALDIGKAVLFVFVGVPVLFFALFQTITAVTNSGRLQSLAGATGSFAAFIGAISILILVIFVMIAMRRGWQWLWLAWMLLALIGAGWVVAFNSTEKLKEQYSDSALLGGAIETLDSWTEIKGISRLGRLLESDAKTGRVRVLIWQGALELIAPHEPLEFPDGRQDNFNFLRPLIGYGPESMYVAYNRFYPPELATVEARNASPDRSHNETFDALVITGWLGFIVWQALYISVFYYGFRWLSVIRSRRDTWIMIGLWIGGAVVAAVGITQAMGMEFLGVGIPVGSIVGLILYLIYYALVARVDADSEVVDPFDVDRLIMIGLVTAVLAHYAEIHFGIAIAATRTHFFVYVGLMFALGYVLPKLKTAVPAASEAIAARKRRAVSGGRGGVWGPALIHALMLALIVGILGYDFTTYSLPPDKVIQSATDLSTWEIFYQSVLINSRQDFSASPFIFVMIILTWALGTLISLSEMAKVGEIKFTAVGGKQPLQRRQIAGGVLIAMSLVAFILRFMPAGDTPPTSTTLLGQSLLLIWGTLSLWGGVQLFLKRNAASLTAGSIALVGLLFVLPALIAGGGWIVLLFAAASGAILYLLWDKSWNSILAPAGAMGFLSLALGLLYAYLHASLLRGTILFVPSQQGLSQLELRVLEASASTALLTTLYLFVFGIILAGAFVLSASGGARVKKSGSVPAYAALALMLVLTLWGVSQTNLRVIHADIVYKRGKPFDARQEWDTAIAIYEKALELAPNEDFYELFLGRALLEAATVTQEADAQEELLSKANDRLIRAQDVNPLNTDHTANLARLNTRWMQLEQNQADRAERLDKAEAYYKDALKLSPQNSVIRNEYARLAYDLKQDCDLALELYNESVEIDPYYNVSFLGLADTYISCAADLEADEQNAYYEKAVAALDAGLELNPRNARAWLQLGQLQQQLENHEEALEAFGQALERDTNSQLQRWQVEYFTALSHQALGNDAEAEAFARRALNSAPDNVRPQIQQFLTDLTGEVSAPPEPVVVDPPEGERPLAELSPFARNNVFSEYPEMVIDPEKQYEAIITTDKGQMRLTLFPEEAPLTVNSFVFLANQGFFDGVTFHRVLDGFMAQGGDPTGTGTGGPGYQFASETDNDLTFDRPGILAMANAGPNTNGSQFFITFGPTPQLNGSYTIFGELTAGEEVLNAITRRDPLANPDFPGDTIRFIEIVEK